MATAHTDTERKLKLAMSKLQTYVDAYVKISKELDDMSACVRKCIDDLAPQQQQPLQPQRPPSVRRA